MIPFAIDYATPSAFQSDRERALLGLTANARRPVRFHGRVARHVMPLRMALQSLGELIWSDDTWMSTDEYMGTVLDPVVTVHPDRVFFEAFSQDQSVYGVVIADRGIFETEGEVSHGTTNVDFTAWLWASLAEMRSSRETWFRVEAAGFEVATVAAGGRFEAKVDLPDSWVRGFLQLQAAMAWPGTRLSVRPVDLLAALRFLRYTKAKISPRALRYEMLPGSDARIVLEPWEEIVPLRGAEHAYTEPRTIRTWGRRRLRLIEPLLPYAESVDIYLKGRAMPSFYAIRLPGVTFVLGLSGWTGAKWTGTGSFDLSGRSDASPADVEAARESLERATQASALTVAKETGLTLESATAALVRLCRMGRAIYDVERREFRHRELFESPIDEEQLFPPDPRQLEAKRLVSEGVIRVESITPRETRKMKKLPTPEGKVEREIVYRDWVVSGRTKEIDRVEIVIGDAGSIIFGTCGCPFFRENLMNLGPCAHMIAMFELAAGRLVDLPTSTRTDTAEAAPPKKRRTEPSDDSEEDEEEWEDEDEEMEEDDDG